MKIISIIPLKNILELLNEETGEIWYYNPEKFVASSFRIGQYINGVL